MKIDLRGRVRNTKLNPANGLLPVFETVINSIHAIEESRPANGKITVTIERSPAQRVLQADGPVTIEPIDNFLVADNGAGFTERNFASFDTADSRVKAAQGGKGIGRITWLKAFRKAQIESLYPENGKSWRRSFEFELTDEGIAAHVKEPAEKQGVRTTVRLVGFRDEYRDRSPRQAPAIARRIVEHCLEYFVMGICPKIVLFDTQTSEQIDLWDLFQTEVLDHSESGSFEIKEKEFRITHVQITMAHDAGHRLNFCAHKRTVRSENLAPNIPNLTPSLKDPSTERDFVYWGYISGTFLDEKVSPERTDFDVYDDAMLKGTDDLSWQDLLENGVSQATNYLTPYTEPIKADKEEQIRTYVQTRAPQFRHLLKHRRQSLDSIPAHLPEKKLDAELYRIDQSYQVELQGRYHELLAANDPKTMEHADYEERLEAFIEEWNEVGMSKLAKHVVHRKATLSFLDSRRELQASGKYLLEDAVHKVIFPLKQTSDDVPPDKMNLWIIDERLSYHYYLASDKSFSQMKDAVEISSRDRPDIIIFNNPAAFVDSSAPFHSIVLIEFKRPARNDFDNVENPITQIYDYVRSIKTGRTKDRRGKPITVSDATPYYAHVICDMTSTLREQAENAGLTQTPDSHGYFGYNAKLGTYVEVISFDKLIDDAKRRNAVLFDQLGLGASIKIEVI